MHKFVTITPKQGKPKMLQTHIVKLTTGRRGQRGETRTRTEDVEKVKVKEKEKTVESKSDKLFKDNIINVFTDRSCIQSSNNKFNRPAGYACVFPEFPSYNHAAKLEGKEKTNNRAEYMACIMALKIADKIDPTMSNILYVHTDSELMINSLTKWLPGWKAKNWKKADGSIVKNLDLLKIFDELLKKRVVVFKHVKAHTGKQDWSSLHNDLADRLAKKAAMSP